jgi:p-aminobenzoyl-glutamate transporter AbgT
MKVNTECLVTVTTQGMKELLQLWNMNRLKKHYITVVYTVFLHVLVTLIIQKFLKIRVQHTYSPLANTSDS